MRRITLTLTLWMALAGPGAAVVLAQAPDSLPPGSAGIRTSGGGGFLIAPRRVVFEDRLRSATVSLNNTGSDTSSFRISLVRMRMSETGEFSMADSGLAGEAFADTLVRYSPRQVELGPHETQVIRLMVRTPPDLPAGEYRSHLLVQSIPRARVSDDVDTAGTAVNGVSVKIVPIFGTAIPVIVRKGGTAAEVSFSDLTLEKGAEGQAATASFKLHRQGNQSVYGDLTLTYVPESGAAQVVGVVKGISVYSPNPTRLVRVPLSPSAANLPAHGRLRLSYTQPAPDGQLIAESSLVLP